jgi:hypothetical protein
VRREPGCKLRQRRLRVQVRGSDRLHILRGTLGTDYAFPDDVSVAISRHYGVGWKNCLSLSDLYVYYSGVYVYWRVVVSR